VITMKTARNAHRRANTQISFRAWANGAGRRWLKTFAEKHDRIPTNKLERLMYREVQKT